jgi:hypothetical protein
MSRHHQVERGDGHLAAPTDRHERAGERDVVDIVSGGLRERTVLPPAGDPPVDEARVARAADVGAKPEALHDAGP